MMEKATACERGKVCVRERKNLIVRGEPERKRADFVCGKEKRFVLAEVGMGRYNG